MDELTKLDKSRQLSGKQLSAIEQILTGRNDIEVAEVVGVTRQTVSQWRNQNFVFQAELNRQRHALWASHSDRLRRMVGQALDVLERELEHGSPQAAFALLRRAAPAHLENIGSMDAPRLEWEQGIRNTIPGRADPHED